MSYISNFFNRVYLLVQQIPTGKVATYGQIAALLDSPRSARTVGWALNALKEPTDVPWHRVLNSKGTISHYDSGEVKNLQKILLEAEGIRFDVKNKVDLTLYQYHFPCIEN